MKKKKKKKKRKENLQFVTYLSDHYEIKLAQVILKSDMHKHNDIGIHPGKKN